MADTAKIVSNLAIVGVIGIIAYFVLKKFNLIGAGSVDTTDPTTGKCTPAWNASSGLVGKPCCADSSYYNVPWTLGGYCIPTNATGADYSAHGITPPADLQTPEQQQQQAADKCNYLIWSPVLWAACKGYVAITQPGPTPTTDTCIKQLEGDSEAQILDYLKTHDKQTWFNYWYTKLPNCRDTILRIYNEA